MSQPTPSLELELVDRFLPDRFLADFDAPFAKPSATRSPEENPQ